MKVKKKRVLEVPPNIRSFINDVISAGLEKIEVPLRNFKWEFDKGDFHHWTDLFTYFDSFFEKYISPRKDLRIEDNFLHADPLFPKAAVLEILQVVRIILENCTNKHFCSSFENNLSLLLASTDPDIVESSLQTLSAFLKKSVGKYCFRDASLTSKLFAFSQGWGGKEEGLGLIDCTLEKGCDQLSSEIGSTLHFEFYAISSTSKECNAARDVNQGCQVIHVPYIIRENEDIHEVLHKLIQHYDVPSSLRFSLLTRLRYAQAFGTATDRLKFICIRLYAFMLLVQASNSTDDVAAFFTNEPEFVNELLSLLSYGDGIPEKIRILGNQSLVALCQDRSYLPTVLSSVTSGSHRGTLPSLMQKAVDSVTGDTSGCSIAFAEALLSLIFTLVSSSPGSLALQEAGFIPIMLPLLKDTNPQHLLLVRTAVQVIAGFLDYHNPSSALLRDLGGLDNIIARLKAEVSIVEKGSKRNRDEVQHDSKGKQIMDSLPELNVEPIHSEGLVSYHRRSLIKILLHTISLATYVPGNSARIDGCEETVLPSCLCIIFRRAKEFGSKVFSLAANVMSDLIHKDPTCFSVLVAADVPSAFLEAINNGVLCSSEAITCIPQSLDALCLNNSGLQLVKDYNALRCFVKIFTSSSYLRALSSHQTANFYSGLEELIRHASSLRASGVDMVIEIFDKISRIGSESESCPCTEAKSSSSTIQIEPKVEKMECTSFEEASSLEGMVETSLDGTAVPIELLLPEYIRNAARLLDIFIQNADTCRLFVEKKGLDAVLKLFLMQFLPNSVPVGQTITVAFRKFPSQHSTALSRSVSSVMKEHLKLTNELFASISGTKILDIELSKQTEALRCLSCLEGLLSISTSLLKGTTSMVLELVSADADILKEVGKVYREVMWQVSLSSDFKKHDKQVTDKVVAKVDSLGSNVTGRATEDDDNIFPVIRNMNPFSVRRNLASHWSSERRFSSIVRSTGSLHRQGRNSLARVRGSRISRQLDAALTDSDGSFNMLEQPHVQDIKKSSDVLVPELLMKLRLGIRTFFATLMKGLLARPRVVSISLSHTSKALATAIAKLFLDALCYPGHATDYLEMSLSVKCRYLGKVVEDMADITVDRHRTCSTALVNSFYVNGTFKELLTTFEATSQLLWTVPFSIPSNSSDQGHSTVDKVSHSPWLLDTLQSYCHLLEYFVNSSLLLSRDYPSHAQLLVQPAADGLSIGLFSVPKDPELFVRMLQSQVLDVILPLWNHPMFPNCSPAFISSVISIVTLIYSGVGDLKHDARGITSTSQQLNTPIDESAITTIVEMGFTRVRAEEALRSVGTNSVEIAMDWLFSHPEDTVQEDIQLAQALALSLGNSFETSKEESSEKTRNAFLEERGAEAPPADDILAVSIKLFQSGDAMAFSLTDLFVTLCNRNKGEDCQKVALYLVQQLKICSQDSSKDTGAIYSISHILALLLFEECSTREIAAGNGVVPVVLDLLSNIRLRNETRYESAATAVSSLFLILDNLLQCKPNLNNESAEGHEKPLSDSSMVDIPNTEKVSELNDLGKESDDVFEKLLGKSTGYLTFEESKKALDIACEFIKMHVSAIAMQAILQLCARLTKTHAIAIQFLEVGGLAAIFSLPRTCMFPGYDSLASAITRHLIEDPQTLQTAMESEIRQTLTGALGRHAGRVSPRMFLTSMAPLISRSSSIFMKAAAAVCHVELSGGRMNVVILKEKDKEKDKPKVHGTESVLPSTESIKISESKLHETPSKLSRSQKRVCTNLSQVIDHLLDLILSYPLPKKHEEGSGSITPMEIDEPSMNEKGKSIVDETTRMDKDSFTETSTWLTRITFVLKLMNDILLMYAHAAGVILRRDSESFQLRGSGQAGMPGHIGILHHVLHNLLPLASEENTGTPDKLKDKLSEKALWFLVLLCGRSTEARRRIVCEIVKAISSLLTSEGKFGKLSLSPDKKVLAFSELVNSILSRNSSSGNLPGPGCSPDVAKAMIDGGMIYCLSGVLQVIDLDHPDAPKVVNLILKALESLTRVANASELIKKRLSETEGQTGASNAGFGTSTHDRNATIEIEATDVTQTANQLLHEPSHIERDRDITQDQPLEQDALVDVEENRISNPSTEDGLEFMHEPRDEGGVLGDSDEIGLDFQVEHQNVDDMGDEDDDDVGEDVEDDDGDDDEDDEEDTAEEGGPLMSLADTDMEDHDDNGIGDDYIDNLIDDEDEDLPVNPATEFSWREGLTGVHRFRLLRAPGVDSAFLDITEDPFQGADSEMYHLHRPLVIERRRPPSGNRTSLDRLRADGNAFQHPLFVRPSNSGNPEASSWSVNGRSLRDLDDLSFAGYDIPHRNMLDASAVPSEQFSTVYREHLVTSAATPLIDFSVNFDSFHLSGRSSRDSRWWTDDGQPQAGSDASTIAQAVENQFVSRMRGVISNNTPQAQLKSLHSVDQANQTSQQLEVNMQEQASNLPIQTNETQCQGAGNNPTDQLVSFPLQGPPNQYDAMVDALSLDGEEESHRETEVRHTSPDVACIPSNGTNATHDDEEPGEQLSGTEFLHSMTEANMMSSGLQSRDHIMQNGFEVPANPQSGELHVEYGAGLSALESHSHSSSYALIFSGCGVQEYSDAHADSALISADVDMNNTDIAQNQFECSVPSNGGEIAASQNAIASEENTQVDQVNINNEPASPNAIDPTFLDALPEYLRAEVLASQQASQPTQSNEAASFAPPVAEIDPEFLAALPPDIQAEVLAQQQARRTAHFSQAEAQPVDMDNASIIATFPPDLREEVLLTSSDAVLSQLPPPLVAEAQMLRERRNNHRYLDRSALFGGGLRFGRRLLGRQTVIDRAVGVTIGRRTLSTTTSSPRVKVVEGNPLLDANALKALIRLLRLAQPLSKGLLHRLLLNLCAHSVTRSILVRLLVNMVRHEADESGCSITYSSQRLYGCQSNVVYGRPLSSNGLPPLVSRRLLEVLTYLATNHSYVAKILFHFDPSSDPASSYLEDIRENVKERIIDAKTTSEIMDSSHMGSMPVIIFLKLLNRPLFLRSTAHLEQVMCLLQVVITNAVAKVNHAHHSAEAAGGSQTLSTTSIGENRDSLTSEQDGDLGIKETVNNSDIFVHLPQSDLRNLCRILAHEGLSDKIYSLAADVLKKLALVAAPNKKFFAIELADFAQSLSSSAISELLGFRRTQVMGLRAGSMAGASILRVLQALSTLVSTDCFKDEDVDGESSILGDLNVALEPLWQELSECISTIEMKLGQNSSLSHSPPFADAGELGGSLPPAAQQLLPFIEAFFVLCEKLHKNQTIGQPDITITAREGKEFAGSSLSPSRKCNCTGTVAFVKVAEKHRRLLNVFIRQNPSLLEKSLLMMLKVPRLIDFDNKRAYFRSRIRQQHDQHPSAPLRISVRRAYILEDSYNQLRLRPTQDLRARLTIQFQGEEGIDAGGLTREWYQLLSRVIFDKGALLFTTVGNNATFQPNPNSVYQTEHLSYFKFIGRVVAKALFDGQLLDVYFTRSFYKHILGVKVTYHDIEAVDPDYYKNLKWMLENDVSDIPDLTFSMDADEEKHILYEKNQVTDYELKPGGRNIPVTEETKYEYVDLVAEHILTTTIRPQINSFLEGFNELVPRELISIFNDKELELLISGLPEIDLDDLKANTEYTGYTAASSVVQWFWEVVKMFNKEDMARLLQFVTGTSKVPLEGFKALQGISGAQRFQIHKAYGAPKRLPSAHTCFNQLDLPEYSSREQLQERLLLAIHEASEGFGFG